MKEDGPVLTSVCWAGVRLGAPRQAAAQKLKRAALSIPKAVPCQINVHSSRSGTTLTSQQSEK